VIRFTDPQHTHYPRILSHYNELVFMQQALHASKKAVWDAFTRHRPTDTLDDVIQRMSVADVASQSILIQVDRRDAVVQQLEVDIYHWMLEQIPLTTNPPDEGEEETELPASWRWGDTAQPFQDYLVRNGVYDTLYESAKKETRGKAPASKSKAGLTVGRLQPTAQGGAQLGRRADTGPLIGSAIVSAIASWVGIATLADIFGGLKSSTYRVQQAKWGYRVALEHARDRVEVESRELANAQDMHDSVNERLIHFPYLEQGAKDPEFVRLSALRERLEKLIRERRADVEAARQQYKRLEREFDEKTPPLRAIDTAAAALHQDREAQRDQLLPRLETKEQRQELLQQHADNVVRVEAIQAEVKALRNETVALANTTALSLPSAVANDILERAMLQVALPSDTPPVPAAIEQAVSETAAIVVERVVPAVIAGELPRETKAAIDNVIDVTITDLQATTSQLSSLQPLRPLPVQPQLTALPSPKPQLPTRTPKSKPKAKPRQTTTEVDIDRAIDEEEVATHLSWLKSLRPSPQQQLSTRTPKSKAKPRQTTIDTDIIDKTIEAVDAAVQSTPSPSPPAKGDFKSVQSTPPPAPSPPPKDDSKPVQGSTEPEPSRLTNSSSYDAPVPLGGGGEGGAAEATAAAAAATGWIPDMSWLTDMLVQVGLPSSAESVSTTALLVLAAHARWKSGVRGMLMAPAIADIHEYMELADIPADVGTSDYDNAMKSALAHHLADEYGDMEVKQQQLRSVADRADVKSPVPQPPVRAAEPAPERKVATPGLRAKFLRYVKQCTSLRPPSRQTLARLLNDAQRLSRENWRQVARASVRKAPALVLGLCGVVEARMAVQLLRSPPVDVTLSGLAQHYFTCLVLVAAPPILHRCARMLLAESKIRVSEATLNLVDTMMLALWRRFAVPADWLEQWQALPEGGMLPYYMLPSILPAMQITWRLLQRPDLEHVLYDQRQVALLATSIADNVSEDLKRALMAPELIRGGGGGGGGGRRIGASMRNQRDEETWIATLARLRDIRGDRLRRQM
jgi:hypothetical protein